MKTLLAIVLSLACSLTFAQGFYVGGSLGMTMVEVDTAARADILTAAGFGHTGVSADEEDTGFKAYVGYRFNRNFAVEGGIVDLGEVTSKTNIVSFGGAPFSDTLTETISTKTGLHVSGLGILPINDRLDFFGKLGFYSIKVDATLNSAGFGQLGAASDSGTDLLFGAGLQYSFTPAIGARIEWERFMDVGSDETGEGDVDLWSIGVVFRF